MMKFSTKLNLLLAIILIASSNAIGQTEVLSCPSDLVLLSNDRTVNYDEDSEGSGEPWVVYSTMENCTTYMSPDGSVTKSFPKFLEKFYITDVEGNYAHVHKDPRLNVDWTLSEKAEDFGWISFDNLIVSPNSLVEEKTLIPRKSMVLNTYKSLENKNKNSNSESVDFYMDPNLTVKTGQQSKIFQIFYVYKVKYKNGEKYSMLVGNSYNLGDVEEVGITNTVRGWIPYHRVVEWNHRIAVEHNSEGDAAEERQKKGIKTSIFESFQKAKEFESGKEVKSDFVLWNSDTYMDKKPGEWIRFPLIAEDQQVYRLGVMGNLDNTKGEVLLTTEENAEIKAKTSNLVLEQRNINVVFVVDGTSSMGPYYKSSIVPAIKVTIKELVNKQEMNSFSFGALIYRDADEGARLTQQIPLSPNYNELINKLNKVEAKDNKDLSKGEALYYGLYNGLKGILTSNNETNVVILVGDAGNRDDERTRIDENKLIDILYKRNANLICFQVRNDTDPSYDDFKTQTMRIVNEVAKKHDNANEGTEKSINKKFETKYVEDKNNSYIWAGARYFECIYASKGEIKKESFLRDAIVRTIEKRNEVINDLSNIRNQVFEEGSSIEVATESIAKSSEINEGGDYDQTDELGAGFIKMMRDAGLTNDQINRVIQDKVQVYNEGYAPINNANLSYPLFNRVLLYSAKEFSDMFTILTQLGEARNVTSKREKLYDIWVETLKRYLGDLDTDEIDNMSMENIHSIVFGIPGANGLIKDLKLGHIKDEQKMDDKTLAVYLRDIRSSQIAFDNIANSAYYPMTFMTNNKLFYWIDEAIIP